MSIINTIFTVLKIIKKEKKRVISKSSFLL